MEPWGTTTGAAVFTAASVLCAMAPGVGLLIAARMVQGVGASLLIPGSLAMIEAGFRVDQRARAIGAWSGLTGVASALGPIFGGYLVTAVSWRAIFLINLPVGLAVVILAGRHLPESRDWSATGRLDAGGAVLATLGLAGATYALITGPTAGATPAVVAAGGIGAVALVAFVAHEHRGRNPMLPLGLFASRQFSAANGVTFVVYAALGGVFFLLVAFLQIALGYSPLASGAATLPLTLLMLAFSARAGALAQRIGPRLPLTIGPLVIALGLLGMTRIEPGDAYLTTVLPPIVAFGIGLTLVVAPITATVLAAAGERHAGVASGVNNAVARVAGLLAVAVLPAVAGLGGDAFYDPATMTNGFHTAMTVSAALAVAGGTLAWATIRNDVLAAGDGAPVARPVVLPAFSCGLDGPPSPCE